MNRMDDVSSRDEPTAANEREALSRIRTSLNARIFGYREERETAERQLETLARLEKSAVEEVRAIDAMLDLTNPHRKVEA